MIELRNKITITTGLLIDSDIVDRHFLGKYAIVHSIFTTPVPSHRNIGKQVKGLVERPGLASSMFIDEQIVFLMVNKKRDRILRPFHGINMKSPGKVFPVNGF